VSADRGGGEVSKGWNIFFQPLEETGEEFSSACGKFAESMENPFSFYVFFLLVI